MSKLRRIVYHVYCSYIISVDKKSTIFTKVKRQKGKMKMIKYYLLIILSIEHVDNCLNICQLFKFINCNSSFLCCTVTPLSKVREDWHPANIFNPDTFCMYVPVPSLESVIQWLSFVDVLKDLFFVHFSNESRPLIHSFELLNIFHFRAFYS